MSTAIHSTRDLLSDDLRDLTYFRDSREHLLAELERLDLLIQCEVRRARARHAADEQFQGLYLSEQEIDEMMARPAGLPHWAMLDGDPAAAGPAGVLAAIGGGIARRATESARRNIELRLIELARIFSLTPLDIDIVLVCLAPELDVRYDRFYGYLHDDVTRRRPTLDLTLNLLCGSMAEKIAARTRFEGSSPLIAHRLVQVFEEPSQPQPTFLGRCLRLDDRVTQYLLGFSEIDTRLAGLAGCVDAVTGLDELVFSPAEREGLLRLALRAKQEAPVFYLHGPYGAGKRTVAEALANAAGKRLLVVDSRCVAAAEPAAAELHVVLAMREARLQQAAIYWEDFSTLFSDEYAGIRKLIIGELESLRQLAFLGGEASWEPRGELRQLSFLRLELQYPAFAERCRLWETALRSVNAAEVDIRAVAGKFRFTAGQINDAVATARNLSFRRRPDEPAVATAEVYEAARLQSNPKLSTLARKINPCYAWRDIVLPADRLQQLREICNCVKYKSTVYGEWGFDRKLSLGKGLNVLFAGPPGTGKTMAAEVIAHELGLDLYKIDLSTMVSKYIGETEKNLSKIFTEAENSNSILFFDEADALFGKRSEVRDSHDRYANIEIGYLLQRMEEYEGVVILATNFRKNMDEAFVRRLHFSLEFPFPNEGDRRKIWEGVWPVAMPLANDVDAGWLARQFELTGGSIRNIALSAAFLAASNGGEVSMPHLLHATRREYQKMGKVVRDGEFGPLLVSGPREDKDA
jgi:SpoVK/Ycf46/Vps4 family AAA+-type ATPase